MVNVSFLQKYNIKHTHIREKKCNIKCFTFFKVYFHPAKVFIKPNLRRYEEEGADVGSANNDLSF